MWLEPLKILNSFSNYWDLVKQYGGLLGNITDEQAFSAISTIQMCLSTPQKNIHKQL